MIKKSKLKIQNYILLAVILSILVFPLVSLADGTYQTSDGRTITYKGLVPCGKSATTPLAPGESPEVTTPCQFCHFFVMFDEIIRFALTLVVIVAVLLFVVAGFMFITAAGNPQNVQKARSIITSTITGLVIIFAAWIIVNTLLMFLGVADWTGLAKGWFTITCPISI